MNTLNLICYCALAATILAVPFLLVNWWKYNNERRNRLRTSKAEFPTKSVSFFLISVCVAMGSASIVTTYARHDALNFLQNLPANYSVFVNQRQVADPDGMISSLKEITPYPAHHSHPMSRIHVDIRTDVRELSLELRRDSERPQEYWVYYSGYSVTSNNEIGRITTTAFDGY